MPFDPVSSATARPLAGILVMLASVLLFSLNDVLGKWLVATYSVAQLLVLRSLSSLAVLGPIAWRQMRRDGWRLEAPRLQVARVLLGALESACFYWAVRHMPLADAMTYWMASPIFVVTLSALLLRERVDAARWLCVLAGFGGVALALGGDMGAAGLPALVALAGSVIYAVFLVMSRHVRRTPDVVLATLQMLGGLAVGLALLPLGGWTTPTLPDLALLLALGLVATCGHMGVTRALKLAPASVVVPYQYSFILWAALFGWAFFGDVPGWHIYAGAAVVVGAGLVLFRLEARRGGHDPQVVEGPA
jgi:drug/metabolite transporter (DMT)-like permease